MNQSSIPIFFIFINLSLGIISLISCINGNMIMTCVYIFIAVFLDLFNNRILQAMNPYNEFGRELHSLSSFISFGVAPAVAAWKTSLSGIGLAGYIILIAFPLCGAFRLAKNSILNFKEVKAGISINIAGFLIVLDNLSVVKFGTHTILSIVFMLLLSYLMVSFYLMPSSIRTKKM